MLRTSLTLALTLSLALHASACLKSGNTDTEPATDDPLTGTVVAPGGGTGGTGASSSTGGTINAVTPVATASDDDDDEATDGSADDGTDDDSATGGTTSGNTTVGSSGSGSGDQCDPSGFAIGGTAARLIGTLVLKLNGYNDLTLSANGAFSFDCKLPVGAPYVVSVGTQPAGQTCVVTSDSGTVAAAAVTTVQVACDYAPAHPACDAGTMNIADTDAIVAAKAMDLCDGVTSATYSLPDGTVAGGGYTDVELVVHPAIPDVLQAASFHQGHGLLPTFGTNVAPILGEHLVALSSGIARDTAEPGAAPSTPAVPGEQGFEKEFKHAIPTIADYEPLGDGQAGVCDPPSAVDAFDGISLNLTLTVPPGANRFVFKYKFYGASIAGYSDPCNEWVDQAAIVVDSPNHPEGNVFTTAAGNPLNLNALDLDVPANELVGTFYETGTTWRTTEEFTVAPGQTVTIRAMIWDSGDPLYDSLMLIDGFKWLTR